MKNILISISRVIFWLIPGELRSSLLQKTLSVDSLITKNSTFESYEYFKETFKTTVLFRDCRDLRKYAIEKAISNNNQKELFSLEFGVWKGDSTNFFSKYVKKLYAFDSFEGLGEDWRGNRDMPKGAFNLDKKIPELNSNIEPVVGFVQDTLDDFLIKYHPKINFVHFDMDTYSPTKYTLERIKPLLVKDAILVFDELYNYPGFQEGELKALKEVFNDDEYIFKAFNVLGTQVVIQIK
tara:strand:- start:121 stop:834 length:714 start_codon:yes stop_codon:yes gene_type:complete